MGIAISRIIFNRLTGFFRSTRISVLAFQEGSRVPLTVNMVRQLGDRPPVETKPNLSDRRLEMELLLFNLGAAGKDLLAALATEAQVGDQFFNPKPDASSSLEQWVDSRQAVLKAQIAYERAANDYRSFINSLAPPLRAVAAARGAGPMALTYTFHNC